MHDPRQGQMASHTGAPDLDAERARVDKSHGILRDQTHKDTISLAGQPTVAFMEHPEIARRSEGPDVAQMEPLQFERRPVLTADKRTTSATCSECTSPFSDATGATSAYNRTPSSGRSETTEASEAPSCTAVTSSQNHKVAKEHHLCCHQRGGLGDHESQNQPVSLLTAVMLSGDRAASASATGRKDGAGTGILRKEAGQTSTTAETGNREQEPHKVSFSRHEQPKPSIHSQFVETSRPKRLGQRRISLPPPGNGPRMSVSPEHYSEGPDSPPRPLAFDAQAHASFLPEARQPAPEERVSAKIVSPQPRRTTLMFQDAEGVGERARAREAVRSREHATQMDQTSQNAEAGPSSKTSVVKTASASQADAIDQRHTPSPSVSRSPPKSTDRKLKFAASPSRLSSQSQKERQRGSDSLRARRSLRRQVKSASLSSDEEQPYVDSVAAKRQSTASNNSKVDGNAAMSCKVAPATAAARASDKTNSTRLSRSPAPKSLGGPEMKRGSGNARRTRSPAPRGRVALPESFATSSSPEHSFDEDELDYDEDDEDDDDDDDDDDDEDGSEGRKLNLTSEEEHEDFYHDGAVTDSDRNAEASGRHVQGNRSKGKYIGNAASERSRRGRSSPHPSVESQSHPAAFSNSDFEDEEMDGAPRAWTDDDAHAGANPGSFDMLFVHSRQRSPAPFGSMAGAGSPLPYARSRISTPAISDIEGMGSGNSGVTSPRMRQQAQRKTSSNCLGRPTLSPTRARSAGSCLGSSPTAIPAPPASLSASRSFSANNAAQSSRWAAPSLLASSEQAQGDVSGSPPLIYPYQSPDAWTTLRSCLESAILSDGDASGYENPGPRQQQRQQYESGARGNAPWSALSTPSGIRSAIFSPNRFWSTDSGSMGDAAPQMPSSSLHPPSTSVAYQNSLQTWHPSSASRSTRSRSEGVSACASPLLSPLRSEATGVLEKPLGAQSNSNSNGSSRQPSPHMSAGIASNTEAGMLDAQKQIVAPLPTHVVASPRGISSPRGEGTGVATGPESSLRSVVKQSDEGDDDDNGRLAKLKRIKKRAMSSAH